MSLTPASATPGASRIPKAGGDGKLADEWLSANVALLDAEQEFSGHVTMSGLLTLGAIQLTRTAVSADYTALETDNLLAVVLLSAPLTISLPAVATLAEGQMFLIADETGDAASNNITLDANGVETINGAGTLVISTAYSWTLIYTNGVEWFARTI